VAVEEMTVTDAGVPRRIEVPVEMPEGVSHRGVFGEPAAFNQVSVQTSAESVIVTGAYADKRIRGQAPIVASQVPAAPQTKTRSNSSPSRKDGSASSRVGGGAGTGVGSGRGYNMGGGSPRLGGGSGAKPPTQELSPQEKEHRELLAKTTPAIAALIERLKKNDSTPTAEEATFVRNGKAELQVWLTDKSQETIRQLKQLGFEVVLDPKTPKLIIGRIAIEKLSALVNLTCVTYVSPMKSS